MEKTYKDILLHAEELLKLANACKDNEQIALRLSRKLLKTSELLLKFSKRVESGLGAEIEVLDKKVHQFLKNCKNRQLFADIHEISMRIIEEASSY